MVTRVAQFISHRNLPLVEAEPKLSWQTEVQQPFALLVVEWRRGPIKVNMNLEFVIPENPPWAQSDAALFIIYAYNLMI